MSTSANRSRKVPDGSVSGIGNAGECGVAVQDVARNTTVAHTVSHSKTATATQHGFGWDTRVAARRAVEFCREKETRVELQRCLHFP